MPHLVATLIYLSQNYSYYIRGDRSPLIYIMVPTLHTLVCDHEELFPATRVAECGCVHAECTRRLACTHTVHDEVYVYVTRPLVEGATDARHVRVVPAVLRRLQHDHVVWVT